MPADPKIQVSISAKATEFQAGMAQIRKDLATLPASAERALKRLDALAPSPFERYGQRFAQAGLGGAGLVRRGASAGAGALGSVARALPGVGVLAGAATIGGFGEMLSRFASGGIELQNTARLAGTTAEGLNSLRWAARGVGLSAGDADQAMLGLNHTLADAAFGRDPTAARLFQQFGIGFGNMRDGAREAGDALPQVVDVLTAIARTNPRAAERIANAFNIPSSALPLLIQGNVALEAQRRQVEQLYGSFDNYTAASRSFTQASSRVGASAEKLGMTVLTAAAPAITQFLDTLSKFASEHQQDISAWMERFTKALAAGDFSGASKLLGEVLTGLSNITTETGRLTTALEVLAATRVGQMLFGGRGGGGAGLALLGGSLGTILTRLGWLSVASLSGDTPGGGSGGPRSPAEQEAIRRRNAPTNDRYGYNGGFLHDTWTWLTGRANENARQLGPRLPGGPMGGFENGVSPDRVSAYKPILDLIGRAEGTDRGRGYNETLAYGKWTNGNVNLTGMTLDQIDTLQTDMLNRQIAAGVRPDDASSATGRYQFTRTTLREMRQRYNLAGNMLFNQATQDMLAYQRIQMAGGLSRAALAEIWASLPDPKTGRSHYQGQRANATGEEVDQTIRQTQPGTAPPAPALSQAPRQTSDATNGRVQVVIHHENVPPGVTMRPSVFGNLELAELRVRQAMPQAGGAAPWTRVG